MSCMPSPDHWEIRTDTCVHSARCDCRRVERQFPISGWRRDVGHAYPSGRWYASCFIGASSRCSRRWRFTAAGTKLQTQCPAGSDIMTCAAAFMTLHLTSNSNAYLEVRQFIASLVLICLTRVSKGHLVVDRGPRSRW